MKQISRYTLGIIAALAFAGCGSQVAPTGGTAQSLAPATHGKSWMLPEAKSEDLIYATGGCGGTCVLSYPQGKGVGALSSSGSSVCADSSGNIFIPDEYRVFEYAHGGTSPIATLSLSGNSYTRGCAVDPTTGDLAVVTGDAVAIFPGGQGQATFYGAYLTTTYCSYDNAGNLFVDGFAYQASSGLSEFPVGGSGFRKLSVPAAVDGPGQIQWDGTYLTWASTIGEPRTVSQLAISGSQATIVGTTTLLGMRGYAWQSWIYGSRIIVPYAQRGTKAKNIGIWEYPKGDKAIKRINNFGTFKRSGLRFQGLAVSVAPS